MLASVVAAVLTAPPNVLFIAVDDLRPDLGCYGAASAMSPNIDRLADRAVVFERHYVQVATCGASRYALLTGRSPASSGVTRNNYAFMKGTSALSHDRLDGAQTFPELLRRNEYRTVCIGKISHTVDNRDFAYDGSGSGRDELPFAWDSVQTPMGPWKRGWGTFFAYPDGVHREDGSGYQPLTSFAVKDDDDLPDGLMATAAVDAIRELARDSQPFLLAVGFYKPHLPWVAPQSDWEAAAGSASLPNREDAGTAYGHRSGEFFRYDMPFKKPLDDSAAAECSRAYNACVRYTDRQIGRVLEALDASGERDNTVVVLWGDHGWCLGDWGLWGKHSPLEEANHSPLIIAAPGTAPGRCGEPTETIDIYPSIVELCQLADRQTAHPLDGASLLQRLHDPAGGLADEDDVAISYWGSAVTVRSKTHRVVATRKNEGWSRVEVYRPESETPHRNVRAESPEVADSLLSRVP